MVGGGGNPLGRLRGRKPDGGVLGLEARKKGPVEQPVEGLECHTEEETPWRWWGTTRGFSVEK